MSFFLSRQFEDLSNNDNWLPCRISEVCSYFLEKNFEGSFFHFKYSFPLQNMNSFREREKKKGERSTTWSAVSFYYLPSSVTFFALSLSRRFFFLSTFIAISEMLTERRRRKKHVVVVVVVVVQTERAKEREEMCHYSHHNFHVNSFDTFDYVEGEKRSSCSICQPSLCLSHDQIIMT